MLQTLYLNILLQPSNRLGRFAALLRRAERGLLLHHCCLELSDRNIGGVCNFGDGNQPGDDVVLSLKVALQPRRAPLLYFPF